MINYLPSINSWKWQSQDSKIFAKLSTYVQPQFHIPLGSEHLSFPLSKQASPWGSLGSGHQPSRIFFLSSTLHSLLTLSFHPKNILKILAPLKKKLFPITKWLSSSLSISHLSSLSMLLGKGPQTTVPTASPPTHCSVKVVWLLALCPLRLLWLWSPWPFISKWSDSTGCT